MRVNRVKSARKPAGKCSKCGKVIGVGDPYVWWKFRFGGRYVRCGDPACYPRAQDLTRSEWVSRLADFDDARDAIAAASYTDPDDAASEVDSLASEVREFGEEQQEKHDNMPEGLQEGDTGQLLQERADSMSNAADELETVAQTVRDTDLIAVDDEAALKEWAEENGVDRGEDESEEDWLASVREDAESANSDTISEALEEIFNVSWE